MGKAQGPFSLQAGMNRFLEGVNVTFRRDLWTQNVHGLTKPKVERIESRELLEISTPSIIDEVT